MARHLADMRHVESGLNMRFEVADRELRHLEPRRKSVCIVGAGLYKGLAPLGDPSYEVWALNLVAPMQLVHHGEGSKYELRADRWFDLHQREAQSDDDMRWIAACPRPIYLTPDMLDASPNAVEFPLREIELRYNVSHWACTFAYQIAFAMWEGFDRIALYGVELAYGTERERTVEWANTAYWVGRAEQLGVHVELPPGSCLGRHPHRYGFEYGEEKAAIERYVARSRDLDALRSASAAPRAGMGG